MTNIDRVDLNEFVFDHDLTLAILLANADGKVYHRYGGRTAISPMNMGSLVALMKEGLRTHGDYPPPGRAPVKRDPLYLADLVQQRLKGRINPVFGCYHCHYAREAQQYLSLEAGTWTPDQYWIYPSTKRIGIEVDQAEQNRVTKILAKSPAQGAGIRAGDVVERLGEARVLTKYDMQWVLNDRARNARALPFVVRRAGKEVRGSLKLKPQWKVGDPADYAWRVRNVYTQHMVKFLPAPGFVGERLTSPELRTLGFSQSRFALRIDQLNYGTHLAGIRVGDVILAAGGKSDFETDRDFYAWCESLRSAGRDIRMEVFRDGAKMNIMVPLASLNYSRVESAPKAVLGFILQQLSGGAGLRVGNVTDGCGAERAGVRLGDRIVEVEGQKVESVRAVRTILNSKSPGDLLKVEVTRDGQTLQFGFVLGGEAERRSEVARLTDPVERNGQVVTCEVRIALAPDEHVYSMHRKGFGVPTQLVFRGRGYEMLGETEEPEPIERESMPGEDSMWLLEGEVVLRQRIRVTEAARFQLLLQVYAQVCDAERCHEFRAVLGSDGTDGKFTEYRGPFEQQPLVRGRKKSGP